MTISLANKSLFKEKHNGCSKRCSEKLHVKLICELCKQPINFECSHCGYITDEKIHVDCKNTEFLLSTAVQN
jgi:predicted amidophosphoribosyltransferase